MRSRKLEKFRSECDPFGKKSQPHISEDDCELKFGFIFCVMMLKRLKSRLMNLPVPETLYPPTRRRRTRGARPWSRCARTESIFSGYVVAKRPRLSTRKTQ